MGDDRKRVVLLGDSITQGLGSKKVNFTDELCYLLGDGYEVVNKAQTGTTIEYCLKVIEEEEAKESIFVLLYGNVDAQIRPNREGKIFPHIPERFRKSGMLMPRPFYSSSPKKRIGQHCDNLFRRFFSNLIVAVDGTEQWVPLSRFEVLYRDAIGKMECLDGTIILCTNVFIDGRLFKWGTVEEYEKYNRFIRDVAGECGCGCVDIYGVLERAVTAEGWSKFYNDDHFHPNAGGYKLMAEAIAEFVLRD